MMLLMMIVLLAMRIMRRMRLMRKRMAKKKKKTKKKKRNKRKKKHDANADDDGEEWRWWWWWRRWWWWWWGGAFESDAWERVPKRCLKTRSEARPLPKWKIMDFVSWDDEVANIWKNKSHVPNHQPVYIYNIYIYIYLYIRCLNRTSSTEMGHLYSKLLVNNRCYRLPG